MKAVLASSVLIVLVASACGGGDDGAPPALTPTPTVASSPVPASPSVAPGVERKPQLIFMRPEVNNYTESVGVIHITDIAGGPNAVQLTPADVRATFAGLAARGETTILYYLAPDETGDLFNLEARDLATGETTTLAATERAEDETYQVGRLSPDGRYVAWGNREGIDLLDLTTDGRRRILTGNRGACEGGALGDCYAYWVRAWSPDGRLLLVQKTFWEGGVSLVVDPFQEAPQEIGQVLVGGELAPFTAAWSPTSDAWCGHGHYEFPSGLYLSRQPEWEPSNLLPEYELLEGNAPWRNVSDCVWLDEHRIAFSTSITGSEAGVSDDITTVSIYDLDTAAATLLVEFAGATVAPQLFAIGGSSTELVFNDREGGQPGLLNTTDGSRTPILQTGDIVLAVTDPIAVPDEVVAATPEVQPCVPLTAVCEVKVTNVAPDQLNVRENASQAGRVVGGLSEGEIVCLTRSDVFGEDDFRWWPMRSQAGLEGWVAQADPKQPDRPWLTATGRKCEQ